jgi:transcriptional regulator with XRE-family HTH domain
MNEGPIPSTRAILRLEQRTLAKRAGISVETIKRFERQNGPLQANFDTIRRLKDALELAGIEFVDGGKDRGPGVRVVAVDRAAVLMDQIRYHLITARDAALELAELVRDDPQLQASLPNSMISVANYLMQDRQIVSEIRRAQRRERSKGGA